MTPRFVEVTLLDAMDMPARCFVAFASPAAAFSDPAPPPLLLEETVVTLVLLPLPSWLPALLLVAEEELASCVGASVARLENARGYHEGERYLAG